MHLQQAFHNFLLEIKLTSLHKVPDLKIKLRSGKGRSDSEKLIFFPKKKYKLCLSG